MRIGDAAAAAGLTPRALRYYEQQGLIAPRRTPSGHREYGEREVGRLRAVRELLEAGLTIADVGAFLTALDGPSGGAGPDGCALGKVSARRLAELDARIERLTRLRARLAEGIEDRFETALDPVLGRAGGEPAGRGR